MIRRSSTAVLALVVLLGLAASSADADAATVEACLGRRLTGVGRSLARRATCYAKDAARPAATTLPRCLAKAEDSFGGGVRSCPTSGDQRAVATALAEYAATLDAQVANPGTPNHCDTVKLTCVGRYVAGIMDCYANAAAKSVTVDQTCLVRSGVRLSDGARGCLDKAEAPGGACSVSDDVATLQGAADQFVADTLCALDPAAATGCADTPTPSPTPPASTTVPTATPTPPAANDAAQLCVDTINGYRASIGLPAYARWSADETCVDGQGLSDSQTGQPHSAFGQCSEWAQNECPGWPGTPMSMIASCLQAMWNEGPGANFSTHGHYINMTSRQYTKVACGFAVLPNGTVWAVQDFQ